jgi:D-3-phosphoglycerate dehydrogenase
MNSPSIPTPSSRHPALTRVLLLENVHKSAVDALAARGFTVETARGALKEDDLCRAVEGVHLLGIRSKTRVTDKVLAAGGELLGVGCFCIGVNQVDLAAANRRGVPVFNAPFSNTRSVAELMIGEMIALSRQLGDRSSEVHRGEWRKVSDGCHEVRGKILGIVGYGHIGQQLGVLAEAMGLRVVFYDHVAKLPMGNNRSLPTLEALLAEAHFVSLHVPATPETHEMIGAAEIAKMRRGSYLLNASRGTVVVIPALAEALRSKHLAGAAVDVYPEEPESNTEPFRTELAGLANVILTPHVGGSTEEAQEAIGREVSHALGTFLTTGATRGAVNFPQVELPPHKGSHRLLNVHRNVPGVLRDVSRIVSDLGANIDSQVLSTDPHIGYLIMDMAKDVSADVSAAIGALPTSIRTRIVS